MRPAPHLSWFDASLLALCKEFPPPVKTHISSLPFYRFEQRTIKAAILLKTVRYISGLHAGMLLHAQGFLYELGVVQRSIQDAHEDAIFLSSAVLDGNETEHHRNFLDAFWQEEPDYQTYEANQKNKHEVPRKTILSHNAKWLNGGRLGHNETTLNKYLFRHYSGFVHGAAPHLMDIYNPKTHRFEVAGSTSPSLSEDHLHDFENYLFRGTILIALVAKALGHDKLSEEATELHQCLKDHYT